MKGAGKIKVSILDDRGNKVHIEAITVSGNIVYPLDMSHLPAGKYTVRIINIKGKVEPGIEVKSKF